MARGVRRPKGSLPADASRMTPGPQGRLIRHADGWFLLTLNRVMLSSLGPWHLRERLSMVALVSGCAWLGGSCETAGFLVIVRSRSRCRAGRAESALRSIR